MDKSKKIIAVIVSLVVALLCTVCLFYNNVIYNGAKGLFSYSQGTSKTVNAYYIISFPYFSEAHLEKIISNYIEDTDLFNKIVKEEKISANTRICIRFN